MSVLQNERRRHLRIELALKLRVICGGKVIDTVTKNISPLGLKFEFQGDGVLDEGDEVEFAIELPKASNPVHARGRVIWKRKVSDTPDLVYDVGCEFTSIEEDNKTTFLRYIYEVLFEKGEKFKRKENG